MKVQISTKVDEWVWVPGTDATHINPSQWRIEGGEWFTLDYPDDYDFSPWHSKYTVTEEVSPRTDFERAFVIEPKESRNGSRL